jgi:hypothetical protein
MATASSQRCAQRWIDPGPSLPAKLLLGLEASSKQVLQNLSVAQAAIDRFRQHLGPTAASWDAKHLAKSCFAGLAGDVRVVDGIPSW